MCMYYGFRLKDHLSYKPLLVAPQSVALVQHNLPRAPPVTVQTQVIIHKLSALQQLPELRTFIRVYNTVGQ